MKLKRRVTFLICLLVLALVGMTGTVQAKTRQVHRRHAVHHVVKKHKGRVQKSAPTSLRTVQTQLAELGYYAGAIDGKFGSASKRALINFQRDHGLRGTGKVDSVTKRKLAQAVLDLHPAMPLATNPPEVQMSMPLTITSRYGKFDVGEEQHGEFHNYTISMNGKVLVQADNQPGKLQISQTYDVAGEDAVVVTVYRPVSNCFYQNYLLIARPDGSGRDPMEIANCNASHVEHVSKEGSLYIGFPNGFDQRNIGDIWRYENGTLNQL